MQKLEMIKKLINKGLAKAAANNPNLNLSVLRRITSLVGEYGEGNCWGTTLWTMKALGPNTFVCPETMTLWLKRNTRKIAKPVFGDILVIWFDKHTWGGEFGELCHTAIYLGDGLYWHQEGMYGEFRVGTLKQVLQVYPGNYEYVRAKAKLEKLGDWQEYLRKNAA